MSGRTADGGSPVCNQSTMINYNNTNTSYDIMRVQPRKKVRVTLPFLVSYVFCFFCHNFRENRAVSNLILIIVLILHYEVHVNYYYCCCFYQHPIHQQNSNHSFCLGGGALLAWPRRKPSPPKHWIWLKLKVAAVAEPSHGLHTAVGIKSKSYTYKYCNKMWRSDDTGVKEPRRSKFCLDEKCYPNRSTRHWVLLQA